MCFGVSISQKKQHNRPSQSCQESTPRNATEEHFMTTCAAVVVFIARARARCVGFKWASASVVVVVRGSWAA